MTKISHKPFDRSLYGDEFFKWHLDFTHKGELEAGFRLAVQYKLKSIIDFGCGIGSYLQGAKRGGTEVLGFEIGGDFAKQYTSQEVVENILFNTDITLIKNDPTKHDCAMCIEVAEHIETKHSARLVENLCNASDFVIFSGAPIGQAGCGHINCQPREFWVGLFESNGYALDVEKTKEIVELWQGHAPAYVINNLMIFKKQ